jgi:hypothetical protein
MITRRTRSLVRFSALLRGGAVAAAITVAACSPGTLPVEPTQITSGGGGGRYSGTLTQRATSAGFTVAGSQRLDLSVTLQSTNQIAGRFSAGDSTGTLQGVLLTGNLAGGTFQATILMSTVATRTGGGSVACEGRGEVQGTVGRTLTWTSPAPIVYDCGLSVSSDATATATSPIPAPSAGATVLVTVRPGTTISQVGTCANGQSGYPFVVQMSETSGVEVTFDSTFVVEERHSSGPATVSSLDMPFTELPGGGHRTYDACSPVPGTYQAFFSGHDGNGIRVRTASPIVTFGGFR